MGRKAFSLVELLVIVAIIVVLSAILFPVFQKVAQAGKTTNKFNLRKIAMAAEQYGRDADERIPIMLNGPWRSLRNTADGQLTQYNEQRTDAWPLLLLPYLRYDREMFVDPRRGDEPGVWSGPALASSDPGYVSTKNTYRNQNRDPMFGVNYEFLSPVRIPDEYRGSDAPVDHMVGEARPFFRAEDPANTVFYTVSMFGRLPQDPDDRIGQLETKHGFFASNAPGVWNLLVNSSSPYVLFWNGTDCSGDWCVDVDPNTPGEQRSTATSYMEEVTGGNNVAFLDGHVRFLSDVELAAGTNYLSATPNSADPIAFGGGAKITDKRHYLWNLDSEFYGA